MVETVTRETTNIVTNLQASLADSRISGGSVANDASGNGESLATASSGTTATGSSESGDAAADDGGDEEASDTAGSGGSTQMAGPNVLIDTSTIGSAAVEIDTPITSSGNASLWPGADGLTDSLNADR